MGQLTPPVFLSPDEAAGLLRVDRKTIIRRLKAGGYPNAVKAGSQQHRIPASDLGIADEVAQAYLDATEAAPAHSRD